MNWILLVLTLPTENATARMRAWRALKASGAAVLRDGVYLLPQRETCLALLTPIANDVQANGGAAFVLEMNPLGGDDFQMLFDRRGDYAALLDELAVLRGTLTAESALDALKQLRKLRKGFAAITAIDYFPGEAQRQADAALADVEAQANRVLSPNEPQAAAGDIPSRTLADYRGRTWATRSRPWVDRLASAWLIQRQIDPDARFLWLATPADCPADALGFDFDGATFSHVGARVTFETLLASFGLSEPALLRIGALVHYLDVGGVQPPEAAGIEQVLAGLRQAITDDDQLLRASHAVFDGLFAAFRSDTKKDA